MDWHIGQTGSTPRGIQQELGLHWSTPQTQQDMKLHFWPNGERLVQVEQLIQRQIQTTIKAPARDGPTP